MIDFTHRLQHYDDEKPEDINLVDSVDSASGRAEAIITMLQGDFFQGSNELTNETVFSALEAIRLECIDIRRTVEHYYYAQKNPNK